MPDRPYTLLSCGMSIDGYLGSATPRRLELSNDADFDRVDAVRASCDAIMVGAATVRNDNPRLLVRSQTRRDQRDGSRAPAVADQGHRDRAGGARRARRLLHHRRQPRSSSTARAGGCPTRARDSARWRPSSTAASRWRCAGSARTSARAACERLMVEGGGKVHTQFLTDNLADELHLVVAPFFVGDSRAPRFVSDGRFPVEPGPPRDARRGPPDRRRRPAALRALSPVSGRMRRSMPLPVPTATIRTHVSVPLRFTDGYTTTARVFSFAGLVEGQEALAFGLGDRAGRGIGLYAKLDAYALQDAGLDTYEANIALGHREDERSYLVAAQMLQALGVWRIALLSNNPDKSRQLRRFGVTVTKRVPTGSSPPRTRGTWQPRRARARTCSNKAP